MKKGEIPDVEFSANASGLTVFRFVSLHWFKILCSPPHLTTPRFIPWDLPGRCTRCKSSTVEIDYVIQPNGVSIFSTRLKDGERFIAFDKSAEFGERALLRLRARNKILDLPLQRSDLERLKAEDNAAMMDNEAKFPAKLQSIAEEPWRITMIVENQIWTYHPYISHLIDKIWTIKLSAPMS